MHRVWQVLLCWEIWGAYLASGVLAGIGVPRTQPSFCFSSRGAVYYHLMVCVILVLLGYRKDKVWRTLAFVVAASMWAGISRVNWMPLPGLLAGLLYLMDQPFDGKKWPRYLMPVLLWAAVGFGSAWLAQQGYIRVSGEDPALFNSAFSSAHWRACPNTTFGLHSAGRLDGSCRGAAGARSKETVRLHWSLDGADRILSVFPGRLAGEPENRREATCTTWMGFGLVVSRMGAC